MADKPKYNLGGTGHLSATELTDAFEELLSSDKVHRVDGRSRLRRHIAALDAEIALLYEQIQDAAHIYVEKDFELAKLRVLLERLTNPEPLTQADLKWAQDSTVYVDAMKTKDEQLTQLKTELAHCEKEKSRMVSEIERCMHHDAERDRYKAALKYIEVIAGGPTKADHVDCIRALDAIQAQARRGLELA